MYFFTNNVNLREKMYELFLSFQEPALSAHPRTIITLGKPQNKLFNKRGGVKGLATKKNNFFKDLFKLF